MYKLFSPDSKLGRFLMQVYNLVMINVLIVASSILVVTIGGAVCSGCYVTCKLKEGKCSNIYKDFWEGLKSNFWRGLLFEVIGIAVIAALYLDFAFILALQPSISTALFIAAILAFIVIATIFYGTWCIAVLWQSRYDEKLGVIFRSATSACLAYFGRSVGMTLLDAAIVIVSIYFAFNVEIIGSLPFLFFASGIIAVNVHLQRDLLKIEENNEYKPIED